MRVMLWNRIEFDTKDRDEAVLFIQNILSCWVREGNRIAWYWRGQGREIGLPNYAVVVDSIGEHTDVYAMIVEN